MRYAFLHAREMEPSYDLAGGGRELFLDRHHVCLHDAGLLNEEPRSFFELGGKFRRIERGAGMLFYPVPRLFVIRLCPQERAIIFDLMR